eukprot:TRINITY_DN2421_c0_g1_i1.p1 TRINITY_DN2421_c0_g1~~TRINITY_DN2421_c0_g1_i1.p1  ORF type:complete len:182 (-),score=51.33 TRINITY_DN2421_c0_g1_i1:13-558(-)
MGSFFYGRPEPEPQEILLTDEEKMVLKKFTVLVQKTKQMGEFEKSMGSDIASASEEKKQQWKQMKREIAQENMEFWGTYENVRFTNKEIERFLQESYSKIEKAMLIGGVIASIASAVAIGVFIFAPLLPEIASILLTVGLVLAIAAVVGFGIYAVIQHYRKGEINKLLEIGQQYQVSAGVV